MYELSTEDLSWMQAIPEKVRQRQMFGIEDIVTASVIALLSGGHVLLEGNPGLGKTALVKALTAALGLGTEQADGITLNAFGRIQFTPDLMPSDITGTRMPDDDGSHRLVFRPGPIFCQLLLADEINRATPKTQSAMLEAMAEYQVTVLGEHKSLRRWVPAGRETALTPFMVLATQNPIDQDGTYPLPEAQSDRFMFKLLLDLPDAEVIGRIIDKELSPPNEARPTGTGPTGAGPQGGDAGALWQLHRAARGLMSLKLPTAVRTHIVNIVQASNGRMDQVQGLSAARRKSLAALVGDKIEYPLGPRAGTALAKAALGWSAMRLTRPEDALGTNSGAGQGLAPVVVPVLRHRLRLRPEALPQEGGPVAETLALEEFIAGLALAAAPDDTAEVFAAAMALARKTARF